MLGALLRRHAARTLSLLVWLTAAAALAPTGAVAQQNPLIARGQSELDDLRFEEALQTLSAALVRAGNTRTEQATIYRLLAFTYLALDRQEEASGAYRSMLPLDPDFQPGADVSPRFRTFFDRVRQEWEEAGRPGIAPPAPVSIQHRSPAQAERGSEVPLTASLEDPASRVSELVLAYRQGTDAVFRRLNANLTAGEYLATIPGEDVAPPLVEYYFEALDAQGLPVAARGDVAAPLRIAVPAPGGDVVEEWWFWTLVLGVPILAGVIIGIVVATQPAGEQPSGLLIVNVE